MLFYSIIGIIFFHANCFLESGYVVVDGVLDLAVVKVINHDAAIFCFR